MSDKSRLYGLIRVAATEPPKRLDGETDKEYLDRMIGLLWPPVAPCWGCGSVHDPDSPGACWEAADLEASDE